MALEIGSITCKVTPDMTGMHPLIEELTATRAALDAAQDEIEARILASERDRELIRQLGVVAPAAYRAIMAAGGVV